MIVVFAGHRVDAGHERPARFPPENEQRVRRDVTEMLARQQPTAVVGAAAAGADIVVLEAAAALGIPSYVVLPFPLSAFREASVADLGVHWVRRFDVLVRDLPPARLVTGAHAADEPGVYERANGDILDRAVALADGAEVVALVIRTAARTRPASVTDGFAGLARRRGLRIVEIDPGPIG